MQQRMIDHVITMNALIIALTAQTSPAILSSRRASKTPDHHVIMISAALVGRPNRVGALFTQRGQMKWVSAAAIRIGRVNKYVRYCQV